MALETHSKYEYHVFATKKPKLFLGVENDSSLDVLNQMDSERMKQSTENRLRLKSIVDSVIFLGKQNIAFKSHREDGKLDANSSINEGNYRELLKFRVQSGDHLLKKHLEQVSAQATYISKTTQNELTLKFTVWMAYKIIQKQTTYEIVLVVY